MNELANVRVETLTAEILFFKRQAGESILEIGRRLVEAKQLIPRGEWGQWLEKRVEFSERSAQKFMKLAAEFDDPHALAVLGATKCLELLALPAEERESFLEEPHEVDGEYKTVEEMSSRELQQVIREKNELLERIAALEAEKEAVQESLFDAEREAEAVTSRLLEAENAAKDELEALKKQAVASAAAKEAAEKKLADAKAKAKAAADKLKDALANPKVPDEVMDKLRAEAAETAAKEKNELAAVVEQERREKAAAEAQVDRLKKELAMADTAVAQYKVYFNQMQQTAVKLLGLLSEMEPEVREKMRAAYLSMMDKLKEAGQE